MTILEITFDGDVQIDKMKAIGNPVFINAVLRDVMDGVRQEWIRLAQQGLQTTKQTYIAAIQEVQQVRTGKASIDLLGEFPNMIENGADSYALQDVMLSGERRVIRFEHGVPGTRGGERPVIGKLLAPKEGSRSRNRVFTSVRSAMKVGRRLHAFAHVKSRAGKTLSPADIKEAGNVVKGPLPPQVQGIYGGLGRQEGTGPYSTFRTMTGDRDAWEHPGIEARNFVDQVQAYAEQVFPAAFEAVVQEVFSK